MKHGAWRVVAILLLMLMGLWLLQYLPAFTFLGQRLEPVRLLSLFAPLPTTSSDSVEIVTDTLTICPDGVVCVEDYSRSDSSTPGHSMAYFYEALYALQHEPKRKVRIAFYGDSFIEAEILTGDLRRLLQADFGGSGVGWLPMRSDRNDRYRSTLAVKSQGWQEYEMRHQRTDTRRLGIAGLYLTGQVGAYTEVQVYADKRRLPAWDEHYVYYAQPPIGHAPRWTLTTGSGTPIALTSHTHGTIGYAKGEGKADHLKWVVNSAPTNSTYWGMSIEGASGIVLDNFSMRSETGTNLLRLPDAHLRDLHAVRPYDLIILQYGLNVMSNTMVNNTTYFATMRKVIAKLQQVYPHTSILLLSVSDRAQRQHGIYATMPAVKPFVATQRQLAIDCGIAFWDVYTAMQYDGGIVGMVDAKPRQAALDYTHINHAGGARIAHHLYNALHTGLQHYQASHPTPR